MHQIDIEMAKYEDASRALKLPEYYIVASNVRLSAAAADRTGKGEGGIDRVEKHLMSWAKKLGIKSCVLWHADTLSALLDTEPSIRTEYDFWVTPGDVLSAVLAQLKDREIDTYISLFLRSQLRISRDIKTKDAGQTTGKKILLDDIFVDLPIDQANILAEEFLEFDDDESQPSLETATLELSNLEPSNLEAVDLYYLDGEEEIFEGDFDERENSFRVVKMIVERCSDKFNGVPSEGRKGCRENVRNRVVLMGGPGQGKSTIGQFLAQIYRARLLETMLDNSPEIGTIIRAVLGRAASEGVPLNGPARFPFLVDLPAYADALNSATKKGEDLSLLTYVASQIARGEGKLAVAALRRWLAVVPTIFILDGLDEVPHASNRSDVIEATNALIDTAYELNADTFTLVTSRPEGYQDELSRRTWVHWDMADLSSGDAIRFGEQLATILVPDEVRRHEIADALFQASKDEATAPLMTSPLQVSLLFALVETRNNIPKDRWTLFYRYYEILRDREIAKGGENGRLIGEYRSEIDRLHYEAGYLLHLRGETSGSASPFLNLLELATIIREQLTRSGYDEGLENLTQKIVTLATTRLVFLRCRTAEHVAFDVRSLQEFMAAARIMASPEDRIRQRLKEIAGISHWSHVFKIACSKVYSSADLESLREEVLAISDSLDAGDRAKEDEIVQSGALLAVQMLVDGVAGIVPASKRNLIARAMRLLRAGNVQVPFLLGKAIDTSTLRAVEASLAQHLRDGGDQSRINSLQLLLVLMHSPDAVIANWAAEYIRPWLPLDESEVLAIVTSRRLIPPRGPILEWLQSSLWRTEIPEVRHWYNFVGTAEKVSSDEVELFHLLNLQDRRRSEVNFITNDGKPTDINVRFRRIKDAILVNSAPSDAHNDWIIVNAIGDFLSAPNPDTLASFLTFLEGQPNISVPIQEMPWIVLAALNVRDSGKPLSEIASEVRRGLWGDGEGWSKLELHWLEAGVKPSDFSPSVESSCFFPGQMLSPIRKSARNSREVTAQRGVDTLDTLQRLSCDFPGSADFSTKLIAWYLRIHRDLSIPQSVFEALHKRAEGITRQFDIYREIIANSNIEFSQFESQIIQNNIINLVGKLSSLPSIPTSLAIRFIRLFNKNKDHRHLLVLIGGALPLFRPHEHHLRDLFCPDLQPQEGDSDLIGEAIALLRLSNGENADIDSLRTVAISHLRRILDKARLSRERVAEILRIVSYRRLITPTIGIRETGAALKTLMEMVEKAKSRLHQPTVYENLKLPAPI